MELTHPEQSEPSTAKRRKLAFYKCTPCRSSKKKCLPMTRDWPEKCQRCIDRHLDCSPPYRVDQYRARSHEPEEIRSPHVPVRHRVNPDDGATSYQAADHAPFPRSILANTGTEIPSNAKTGSRGLPGEAQLPEPAPKDPIYPSCSPSLIAVAGDAYKYERLHRDEIRIARLLPGSAEAVVEVEISTERLNSSTAPYQVLSWHWGAADDPDQEIRIRNPTVNPSGDKTEPTWPLKVKHSLWTGLKRLRDDKNTTRLWIDAICIDQLESKSDLEESRARNLEKSEQVCLMNYLLAHAAQVAVWIGEPPTVNDDVEALGFIKKIMSPGEGYLIAGLDEPTFERSITATCLHSFLQFLQQPWFNRRWVVQEIALARSATVYYGKQKVEWNTLATAISLLETLSRTGKIVQGMMNGKTQESEESEGTASISSLAAYRLVQNTDNLLMGKDEDIRNLRWRCTLEELVSFLAVFRASSLHDTIYAVLGISSDFKPVPVGSSYNTSALPQQQMLEGTRHAPQDPRLDFGKRTPFPVDYEQDPLVLFKKFAKMVMKKSGTMDILCRPWAPIEGRSFSGGKAELQSLQLPSWMPNLDGKPFQPNNEGRMIRLNPDPLVGPPVKRQKYYNASGSRQIRFKIDLDDQNANRLAVKGFVLDTVGQTWDAASFGNVPGRWLEAAGNWKSQEEPPPGDLWRTLVADRGTNGYDSPELWWPWVLRTAVKQSGTKYGFLTHDIIARTSGTVAGVFRRIQAVVWNRRMIRTKGDFLKKQGVKVKSGVLGLAPEKAERGDLVVIIFGCSVPLLLRPVPPGSPSDSSTEVHSPPPERNNTGTENGDCFDDEYDDVAEQEVYNLVGECYIDSMMDGQAMDYFENEGMKARWFNIE